MKQKIKLLALFFILTLTAHAQCTFRNTAFGNEEHLNYNLYYNWQFVWVKAGTALWSTVASTYHGTPAYKASLITRGTDGWINISSCATHFSVMTPDKWRRSTIERGPEKERDTQ